METEYLFFMGGTAFGIVMTGILFNIFKKHEEK
jgi:hypothetical protein